MSLSRVAYWPFTILWCGLLTHPVLRPLLGCEDTAGQAPRRVVRPSCTPSPPQAGAPPGPAVPAHELLTREWSRTVWQDGAWGVGRHHLHQELKGLREFKTPTRSLCLPIFICQFFCLICACPALVFILLLYSSTSTGCFFLLVIPKKLKYEKILKYGTGHLKVPL